MSTQILPTELFTDEDLDLTKLRDQGVLSPADCLLPLRSSRKIFAPNSQLINFALVDEKYLTFLIKFVNNSKRSVRGSRRRGQASTGYWQVGYDDVTGSLRPPHTTTTETRNNRAIRFSLNRVVYLLDKISGINGSTGLFNAMAQFMNDKEILYEQTLVIPKLMFVNGIVLDCRARNICPIRTVVSGKTPYNEEDTIPDDGIRVDTLGRKYNARRSERLDKDHVFVDGLGAVALGAGKPIDVNSTDTTTPAVSGSIPPTDPASRYGPPPEIQLMYSRVTKQTVAGWILMYGCEDKSVLQKLPWIQDWAGHSYEAVEAELKTLELIGDIDKLRQLSNSWAEWKLTVMTNLEARYPMLKETTTSEP